jgi:hypothetical protein
VSIERWDTGTVASHMVVESNPMVVSLGTVVVVVVVVVVVAKEE